MTRQARSTLGSSAVAISRAFCRAAASSGASSLPRNGSKAPSRATERVEDGARALGGGGESALRGALQRLGECDERGGAVLRGERARHELIERRFGVDALVGREEARRRVNRRRPSWRGGRARRPRPGAASRTTDVRDRPRPRRRRPRRPSRRARPCRRGPRPSSCPSRASARIAISRGSASVPSASVTSVVVSVSAPSSPSA